jgi:hypothetical protein
MLVRVQTEQSARFLFCSAQSGRLLLFVNSSTATLMSRVSSAIENSWLVTGLVTVNGNRGGDASYSLGVGGIIRRLRYPQSFDVTHSLLMG